MSKWKLASAVALLAWQASLAHGRDNDEYQYKPMPFAGGGYSEKIYAPDRWKTRGRIASGYVRMSRAHPENAPNKAMYRMALLARASGFDFFQVFKVSYIVKSDGLNFISANAELWGRGVDSATAPLQCETGGRLAYFCRNYPVDLIIAEIGPQLGQTRAMADEEVAALKANAQKPSPAERQGRGRD